MVSVASQHGPFWVKNGEINVLVLISVRTGALNKM